MFECPCTLVNIIGNKKPAKSFDLQVFYFKSGGGGGNWTPVRKYSAIRSTCLSRSLF